jgi:hypothetical protein
MRIDTLKIRDTTITTGIKFDSIFHYKTLTDTFKITKEKLKIKLIQVNDTIYLDAEVKADTVYFEKKIAVEKIVNIPKKSEKIRIWKLLKSNFGIVILLLIILVILICRK